MNQATQIQEARAFVDGALAQAALERRVSPPSGRGRGASASRECSVCELPKPAASFRQVIGRVTTEACASCCDLRDEVSGAPDPLGPAAIAEFCLRVATKRFDALAHARATARTMLLPRNGSQKKKESALAKDPKEYAARLQKLPDRVAATLAKTYAVKGDAFELADNEALIMIMDLINGLDSTLIERNTNKKLARRKS